MSETDDRAMPEIEVGDWVAGSWRDPALVELVVRHGRTGLRIYMFERAGYLTKREVREISAPRARRHPMTTDDRAALVARLRKEAHDLDAAYRTPEDGPSITSALLLEAADALSSDGTTVEVCPCGYAGILTDERFIPRDQVPAELRRLRERIKTLEGEREAIRVLEELRKVASWIRTPGNINREDAIDDCARVLENRARDIEAAEREVVRVLDGRDLDVLLSQLYAASHLVRNGDVIDGLAELDKAVAALRAEGSS